MSGYIRIRVFQDEKTSLKKQAEEKGMSLSELIRAAALAGKPQRAEASL